MDFAQFDQVTISSPEALRLLHDPAFPNRTPVPPEATWSVTHIDREGNLIICYGGVLARIAPDGVQLVAKYSLSTLMDYLRSTSGYGQKQDKAQGGRGVQ